MELRDTLGRIVPAIAAAVVLLVPGVATAAGDCNDAGIDWKPYEEGLQAASESGKPICLVFYTEWCPHCKNYAQVFHDEQVVEESKQFVMIRLDKDKNRELSALYAPDGEYIPRTYFLDSKGDLDASIHAPRQKFLYFYDEHKPASVLAGMQAALDKLE